MFVQKLGDSVDEVEIGDIAQRDPARLGGIVAGDGLASFEDRGLEVQDDEVTLVVDAFRPTDEFTAGGLEAGLFHDLTDDGFDE